ncbi:hypothetical protein [Bacteroides congonensis]|uniref:hypothetical protein n=1 Tax=Bacteroides congonensis TaxID=1871006 RepID=UPI001114E2B7|nr:hypothetical protein [Bacteroides congonensis]
MTRKLYFLIPCLIMAMMAFTGCSDDNNDGPTGGEVLSAEQSKEKLSEIGQKLIGLVNADDQKQLAQVGNYFSEIVGSLEIQENVQQTVQSLVAASHGDMAKVYTMAAFSNDIYQASDYYGIYTYNVGRKEWELSTEPASALVLKFAYENQDAEVRVATTGNTTDFTYDDVTVKVPAKVTATIKLGSTTLTSLDIATANVSNSPRKADITVNVDAKGYKISTSVSATPQVVKANYSINIKGTEAVKGEAYLNGSNMTADEGVNEDINERFNDARAEAVIMNEATVDLKCSSYKNLASELEQVEDQYYTETEMWGESQKAAQATADVYKKYLNGNLAFGGSENPSAILAFQPYIYYTSSYGGKREYWDVEPLLQFEDESLISFEDYFDAASGPFKSLADSFEALVRSFEGFIE